MRETADMTARTDGSDAFQPFSVESEIPVLSAEGRDLIDGRMRPETYIAERRRHAEQAAREQVEHAEQEERTASFEHLCATTTAAFVLCAAIIAGALSLHNGELWLVALVVAVVAVVVAPVMLVRLTARRRDDVR
jgi:Flp pilus assembly protein TadB